MRISDWSSDVCSSDLWLVAPSIKPNDLAGIANARGDLYGAPLDSFMRRAVKHIGNMIGMAEALPLAENRITLGGTTTNLCMRAPVIAHRHDPVDLAERKRVADGKRVSVRV